MSNTQAIETTQADNQARAENQNETQNERTRTGPVYRAAVDVIQTDEAVVLIADVPGVDESGLDLTLEKNLLTVRGNVQPVNLPDYRLTYAEYGVGDFERTFTLSDDIDRKGIEATVKDGVLRIRLPKSKEAASRKITVKAG